jgi:hypothetical protein
LSFYALSARAQFGSKRARGGEIDPLRYERNVFHMGFSITGNTAKFKLTPTTDFLLQDSLSSIRVQGFPGFGLGGITNLRLGGGFHLRALPQLHFNQRNVNYTFKDRVDVIQVESVSFDIPLLVKYQGKRSNNMNMYVVGGIRPTHDFGAREDRQRGPFIKQLALKKQSLSYEFGFGFDIYTYHFKFSPEFKMSNSITNMIANKNDPWAYNGFIHFLQSRLFQISLHFE